MMTELTPKELQRFEAAFDADPKNRVAMNAVTANGIQASAKNVYAAAMHPMAFSVEVETWDVSNQKSSGRCWMFAALNVMRREVMKRLNLGNMELSQSYPLFYDKLERSNYFLENILDTLSEPLEGRLVHHFLADPIGDGGQWDMFRSIVAKYGVVPQTLMPETAVSSATRELNGTLARKLREFACVLRSGYAAGKSVEELREEKTEMLSTVYRMLVIALGKPPVRFTWETRDKDRKFVRIADVTPQEFFQKYVGWDLEQYVTVINAPTADKPYGKTYTVHGLGSVKNGAFPVKYLNLPMDELRQLTIRQLQDGKTVWFGSDVGKCSDRARGLLSVDTYDLEGLFGTGFGMNKAQRLDYGESLMTHAMVITGVDLDEDGKPLRWKVENSWGKEAGINGYYVMDDAWFGEYAYQILLEKRYLSPEQAAAFEQEPVVLAPWDPMGSLA